MPKITISENKEYFVTETGEPFFYLGDTVWSTFTNAKISEWKEYLDYRERQGFNVLQINILRQWDASESELDIEPFATDNEGKYNYHNPNEEYFARAEKMLEMAVNRGFVPALVVLWGNYAPGTWIAEAEDHKRVMEWEEMEFYVDYAVDRFAKFKPLYLVSGDTGFQSEEASAYYLRAMEIIKEKTPEALTTLHLRGREHEVGQKLLESEYYDFYMYQSCHFLEELELAYTLPQKFREKKIKRPIINGEPCYEGITDLNNHQQRVRRHHTRKAIWHSLLSGAGTGVTYGAHGLWSWHKEGMDFGGDTALDEPFSWSEALRFDGADDAAQARYIFENYDLFGCEPKQEWILNDTDEIRAAVKDNCFALYVPHNKIVDVDKDLSEYKMQVFELGVDKVNIPRVKIKGGKSVIQLGNYNNDRLIVGQK